ncbi:hypothetical protein B0H12DRAFT_1148645, partial [Mycena haematopus]
MNTLPAQLDPFHRLHAPPQASARPPPFRANPAPPWSCSLPAPMRHVRSALRCRAPRRRRCHPRSSTVPAALPPLSRCPRGGLDLAATYCWCEPKIREPPRYVV